MASAIMISRIEKTFVRLRGENRAAFIPFIMGGDPTYETSLALMKALPDAGADIIELGVCFTDPMADGPAIQAAGLRALANGQTLARTLDMVRAFREDDNETPIVLMGYYNPFFAMGVDQFLIAAQKAGVDGLIIVDLPPEEDAEMCIPARNHGIDFIRLTTPTTDEARLPDVIANTSGFVYYVSVAGVTGAGTGKSTDISSSVARIKRQVNLPVAVGFGIKTTTKAAEVARVADAVVVGSAIVEMLAAQDCTNPSPKLDGSALENAPQSQLDIDKVINFTQSLSQAVHSARK